MRKASEVHSQALKKETKTNEGKRSVRNDFVLVANTITKETPVNYIPVADVTTVLLIEGHKLFQ